MLAATAIGPTARIATMMWALSRMADIAVEARAFVRSGACRQAPRPAEIWPIHLCRDLSVGLFELWSWARWVSGWRRCAELDELLVEPLGMLSTAQQLALAAHWERLTRRQAAMTHRICAVLAQA